jgi:hypothetical protein
MSHSRSRADDLADLLNAGATIGASLTPCSNLSESSMALADLFVDLAIGDAFADTDEHGGRFLLELIIVFSAYLQSTAATAPPQQ